MKNIIHSFLKTSIRITSFFFFEKIEVSGTENLPVGCPVIFACNHPNSFLDSIVMTTCAERELYYTARGDFFKSKLAATLLHYIHILPVFRKEEGKGNLHKNEETFSDCLDIFKRNGAVVIFSEGLCENEWDLRPLRKGTARLAFDSWNNDEIKDTLKVVPVAIHYSSWLRTSPRIYIEFLENIERSEFASLSESGIFNRQFNEKLQKILSAKCAVVDKSFDVPMQNKMVGFILKNFHNGAHLAKQVQNKFLAEGNEKWRTDYMAISNFLTKEKMSYYKEKDVNVFSFVTGVILLAIAFVFNAIPYFLSRWTAWKSTKGNAFYDSLIYCVLWLIYFVYLIVLFTIFKLLFNVWAGIAIVAICLLSAAVYEASKRNIECFLKKNKLKELKQMLTRLFETSNG